MKKLKRISIALTLIFNSNLLLAQVYFNLSNVGMAPLQNTGIGVNNITDLNSRFCTSIGNGNIINYSNTAIAIGALNNVLGLSSKATYGVFAAGIENTIEANSNGSFALGGGCKARGDYAFSIGFFNEAFSNNAYAIGRNLKTLANGSFTIGSGSIWGGSNPLVNTRENSLIMGLNSDKPTFCLIEGGGNNKPGHVGILMDPHDPVDFAQLTYHTLCVKGDIIAEKVQVALYSNWPDYVFDKNYPIKSLIEVENYINRNGHLPDLPSKDEVQCQGFDLAEMDAKLLLKIEELTLYVIQLRKENDELKTVVNSIKNSKK